MTQPDIISWVSHPMTKFFMTVLQEESEDHSEELKRLFEQSHLAPQDLVIIYRLQGRLQVLQELVDRERLIYLISNSEGVKNANEVESMWSSDIS